MSEIDHKRVGDAVKAAESLLDAMPREEQLTLLAGLVILYNAGFTTANRCGVFNYFTPARGYRDFVEATLAKEVLPRPAQGPHAAELVARSSIGAGLADIKARGIDAHLVDLEAETKPRRRRKR